MADLLGKEGGQEMKRGKMDHTRRKMAQVRIYSGKENKIAWEKETRTFILPARHPNNSKLEREIHNTRRKKFRMARI